jgi:20S proteasome subunit alpha 7
VGCNVSIYLTHGESTKDTEFELEMTWIGSETNNRHDLVPKDFLDVAEREAKNEDDEDEQMEEAE